MDITLNRYVVDQPLIDISVIRNCKRRKANPNMAWVDFRKAYDVVPHTWIIKNLKLICAATSIIALLKSTIIVWKTELISGQINLSEVNINQGIFKEYSFPPLPFIASLFHLTLVLRKIKQGYLSETGKYKLKHLILMGDLKAYKRNQNGIDAFVRTVKIATKVSGMKFVSNMCGFLAEKKLNAMK